MTELLQKYKNEILIGGVALLILGSFFYFQFSGSRQEEVLEEPVKEVVQEEVSKSAFKVDIKGAILQEGVYEVQEGDCVLDVIQLAGGLTDDADTSLVNLSKRVEDQMVIVIPTQEEVVAGNSSTSSKVFSGDSSITSTASGLVSINRADASMLQTLPGIGAKKASDIIAYREEHGGFQSLDELMNVKGIGSSTYEKLKSYIEL